jgi:hypothetical protein
VKPAEATIPDRCSLRSEEAGEELAGTASTIRRWLLVEHEGPWGRDALRDARMPSELSAALRSTQERTGARVLLIRRPDHHPGTRDFRPERKRWQERRQGAWVESHATYDYLDVESS